MLTLCNGQLGTIMLIMIIRVLDDTQLFIVPRLQAKLQIQQEVMKYEYIEL